MAFNLPKNAREVVDRITSDIVARLPDSGSFLFVSFFKSLITGFGLRIYNVYSKIPIMITQFYATTAQNEYLLQIGSQWGISRNPAVGSRGNVVLTGTASTLIPNGTLFNSAGGLVYESPSNATISQSTVNVASMSRVGATVTVNFTENHNLASGIVIDNITGASPSDFNASNVQITVTSKKQFIFTQAGTSGSASGTIVAQWTTAVLEIESQAQGQNTNMVAGSILNLASPILGVDNQAYVDFDEISGGADIEDLEDYRARLLFRIRNPKTLFNNSDIIAKAETVSGVSRVWVFNPDSTVGNITPTSIARSGNIATVNKVGHGLYDGNFITITGASQVEYNVIKAPILKIDDDNFIFIVSGSPATPATGAINIASSYVELGQVKVSFVRDNDDSQIPSALEVEDVKNALLEIKPAHIANQDIIVFAPTAVTVNFTFASIAPSTEAMKTAIKNSLTDFFKIYNNVNEDIKLNDINGILSQVIDSGGNLLNYTLTSPSANIEIGLNEIAVLGTITYS
jgi:uncharacterized phage protein gp47/JayE